MTTSTISIAPTISITPTAPATSTITPKIDISLYLNAATPTPLKELLTQIYNETYHLVPHLGEQKDAYNLLGGILTQNVDLDDLTQLGEGSFKEVFDLTERLVLKLSTEDICEDRNTYFTVKASPFYKMFATTFFFQLDADYWLHDGLFDEEVVSLSLQEKCIPADLSGLRTGTNGKCHSSLYNGIVIDAFEDVPEDWVQSIIDEYGELYLTEFMKLLIDSCIGDIRTANVGYTLDGKPIIFDWRYK